MSTKNKITLGVMAFIAVVALLLGSKIIETVEKGTYQIKQAAVTGTMSAKMTPGIWLQLFGDIEAWPKAETYFFTADEKEGAGHDQSIEVRYNDGSLCDISGTTRIILPTSEKQAIALTTEFGYKDIEELEAKLILPTLRNALRLTANLMSARESYAEKRTDFIFWAWDQVQNGLYETTEEIRKIKDPISGEEITKTFKRIKKDVDGNPIYQHNPLLGTGITLANFEVKKFVYAEEVKVQIAEQQKAIMGVATARANAQKAEQEKLTEEAQGKARVMKAQYQEEEIKVKAVVKAQKDKEVAELAAERELEVAKLHEKAAAHTKQEQILLGEGLAERKRLVMRADGALRLKTEVYERVMGRFAQEFGKQKWVPEVVFNAGESSGSSGSSGNEAANLISILTATSLKDLGLDMTVPKGKIVKQD